MNPIADIREKINGFLLQRNTIDRIMTDKIDDFIIIQEQPLPIQIGEKIILVGNFTFETEQKFFTEWMQIPAILAAKHLNKSIMFDMMADPVKFAAWLETDKYLFKALCKTLKHTLFKQQAYYLGPDGKRIKAQWNNCSWGYFKKNVTKEQLIQIVYLIYLYNFDSTKHNFGRLLRQNGSPCTTGELYIFLASELSWTHGEILSCPSAKYRLLLERYADREPRGSS